MADGNVHCLPQMDGEPKHHESVLCWCKPRVERGGTVLVVVHRCLTHPEQNTITEQVEVS